MPPSAQLGPYFCEQCTARYADAGDCVSCLGEPLLDLRDPDVVLLIASFDQQRWQKRVGFLTGLAAFLVVPVVVGLAVAMVVVTGESFGIKPILLTGAFGIALLSSVLIALFPSKARLPTRLPDA